MSGRDELRAAVALAEADGLGPRRIALLVDATGSARSALAAVAAGRVPRIRDPGGRISFPPKLLNALRGLRPASEAGLRELESRGVRIVVRNGPGYPRRLEHLDDPPAVLWLEGPGALPERSAVAVVGTRRATEYGRRMARDLARGLVGHGFTVVSGMATGIDGAAHRAALDAGGATVGVLGSGVDHPYPRANAGLFDRMRRGGSLATEFPPAERARRGYFPRRNRIIAALAEAVVVVQAGRQSGALNTATHGLDLGREVLAVPGPVGAPGSVGVHGLLVDGAGLATRAEDVLRELGVKPGTEGSGAAERRDRRAGSRYGRAGIVWARLDGGPRALDDLADALALPAAETLALLGRLELAGVVRALPGGRYERAEAGRVPAP